MSGLAIFLVIFETSELPHPSLMNTQHWRLPKPRKKGAFVLPGTQPSPQYTRICRGGRETIP